MIKSSANQIIGSSNWDLYTFCLSTKRLKQLSLFILPIFDKYNFLSELLGLSGLVNRTQITSISTVRRYPCTTKALQWRLIYIHTLYLFSHIVRLNSPIAMRSLNLVLSLFSTWMGTQTNKQSIKKQTK